MSASQTSSSPTILAMGGGGFQMEPHNPLLDDFALSLTGVERPRVCLLPTAVGDSPRLIAQFYASIGDDRAARSHLSLFGRVRTDVREFLLAQDLIYVTGGNTANMLAIWRLHGVDRVLREAWERGVVLAGLSAGMICWFEGGVTDSFGPLAAMHDGLGFLPGTACPHYDGEVDRRPRYEQMVADGFAEGVAADDGAALLYRGTELAECVSSRPNARAFRVTRSEAGVQSTPLPTRYLRT